MTTTLEMRPAQQADEAHTSTYIRMRTLCQFSAPNRISRVHWSLLARALLSSEREARSLATVLRIRFLSASSDLYR